MEVWVDLSIDCSDDDFQLSESSKKKIDLIIETIRNSVKKEHKEHKEFEAIRWARFTSYCNTGRFPDE